MKRTKRQSGRSSQSKNVKDGGAGKPFHKIGGEGFANAGSTGEIIGQQA